MTKKKSAPAAIRLQPGGPIIVGNTYTAYASLGDAEGVWLRIATSGTGRMYQVYVEDDVTRGTFFVDRAGEYKVQFVSGDKVLAEVGFSV